MNNLDIIQSFRQGGTGNCASIAIIKAGIEIFGIGGIINHQFQINDDIKFQMRDGFEGHITASEHQQAINNSEFIVINNQEVLDYANICFAAMAKRAMMEGNDELSDPTYEQAIATLNDGEYYLHGANWIGLRHHIRSIGRKYALHHPGCVGASRKHCFYVSHGIEDNYGKPDRLSLFERSFASWFRVAKEPAY